MKVGKVRCPESPEEDLHVEQIQKVRKRSLTSGLIFFILTSFFVYRTLLTFGLFRLTSKLVGKFGISYILRL